MKLTDHEIARRADPSVAHLAGWIDLLGVAVKEGSPRVQRIHLQIAESVFNQVDRFPPAQPAVHLTRTLHGFISNLSYSSVKHSGAGLSYLARRRFRRPG